MKSTLVLSHSVFRTMILLLSLPGTYCRCYHSVRVAMVPGVIVFNGHEKNGCVWTLHSPDSNGIKLMVLSTTFTEDDCTGSRLEIQDGTFFGGHIGDICDQTKRTIPVKGHYIHLIYHASASYRRDRFRIKYTVYDSSVCNAGYRLADSSEQTIISPNYPRDYPKNINCKWLIDSDSKHKQIKLEVRDSEIEGNLCFADYVEAYDGSSSSAKSLGRWCGEDKPTKLSSGRYMYIEFKTDAFTEKKGFKIAYSTTTDGLQSTHVGAIVGGMAAAGIVIIALVICGYYCYKGECMGMFKRSPERHYGSGSSPSTGSNVYSSSSSRRQRTGSVSLSLSSQGSFRNTQRTTPVREDLPPAYDDVIKNEPPSYFQAINDNMAQSANHNSHIMRNNEGSSPIRDNPSEISVGQGMQSISRGADNVAFQSD